MTNDELYGWYNTGLPTHIDALRNVAAHARANDPEKEEMRKSLLEIKKLSSWLSDLTIFEIATKALDRYEASKKGLQNE